MDIDGKASNDQSGKSVSVSADGNTVLIGSPYHKVESTANAGLCRVYRFNGTDWNQLGNDIIGSKTGERFGWSVALSADGNVLAIGAPFYSYGRVQVYNWNGASWSKVGSEFTGSRSSERFGTSVALSSYGNILAIGSPEHYKSSSSYRVGMVEVWTWQGASWVRLGGIIYGYSKDALAGSSVSLSPQGTTIAIGSPGSDDNIRSGYAEVYRFNGTAWNLLGDRLNGTVTAEEFGCSVSLSSDGNTVAVGARHSGIWSSGRVVVYSFNETDWTQVGSDIDGAAFDRSGSSVSLSSDGMAVAIGSPYSNANGALSGHVGIYHWDGSAWSPTGNIISGEASNDYSGTSVSLSVGGNVVAIGAVGNDGLNGTDSGHVRVFKLLSL